MQNSDRHLELLLEESLEKAKISGTEMLVHFLNMALYEHRENMRITELKRLGTIEIPSEHQS